MIVREQGGAHAFGALLRSYRERAGLTQRELATLTEVDETTISKMETGTRHPPREAAFYERLRRMRGVSNFDVNLLLRTDGAPAWLLTEVIPPRCTIAVADGVLVPIYADPGMIDERELEELKQLITWAVEDFKTRRARRPS